MVGSCDVKFPIRLEGLVLTHSQFSRWIFIFSLKNKTNLQNFATNVQTFTFFRHFSATSRNCFPVWFTVWSNRVLYYSFSYRVKWYSLVSMPDIFKIVGCRRHIWHLVSFAIRLRFVDAGAKVRQEIYDAFDNIYPILKSFKKQWKRNKGQRSEMALVVLVLKTNKKKEISTKQSINIFFLWKYCPIS